MKLSLNMWSSDILTKLFDQIEVLGGRNMFSFTKGPFLYIVTIMTNVVKRLFEPVLFLESLSLIWPLRRTAGVWLVCAARTVCQNFTLHFHCACFLMASLNLDRRLTC